MKKKILAIVPAFTTDRPQAIRMKNLLPYLHNYKIDILQVGMVKSPNTENINGLDVITIPGKKIGIIFNKLYYSNVIPVSSLLSLMWMSIRKILKIFVFPDLFIIENKNIEKYIFLHIKNNNYDAVLLSCAPFSLLKLGAKIKAINPDIKILADYGDPFFKNNINKSFVQRIFSYSYEKKYLTYIDILCVTNQQTLDLYQKYFRKYIKQIEIINHGTELSDMVVKNELQSDDVKLRNGVRIVYMGLFYRKIRDPRLLFNAILSFNQMNNFKVELDLFGKNHNYFLRRFKKLSKIRNMGFIPFDETKSKYQEYDIVLYFDNYGSISSPGKIYEVLALAKPVLFIYNKYSLSVTNFKDTVGVYLVENKVKAITDFFNQIKISKTIKKTDIKYLEEYSWKKIGYKLDSIIQEILCSR